MHKQNKILLIDDVHDSLPKALSSLGFDVVDGTAYSEEKIEQEIREYYGLVIRSRIFLGEKLLSKAKNLGFIARAGAGMESIDVSYAESRNIRCLNSPEGNRDAVAEHCLGLLLSLSNKLQKANNEVKRGIWKREENRGFEIGGKTVSIIGYGNMGSAFSQRLKSMNVHCIAYDKYKTAYTDEFVKESTMEEVFEYTDILSLHLPLTEETRYLVDKNYLSRFKKNIVLINTARGPIVKTNDLVEALQSKKIIAAALDVLEYEKTSFENLAMEALPDSFHFLAKAENVILTPHIAGWTVESRRKHGEILLEKIKNQIIS